MERLHYFVWELKIDSPEKEALLKKFIPDWQLKFRRFAPEPEDLLERWDDEMIHWFYEKAWSTDMFGKSEGEDVFFDPYYSLPRDVGTGELADYFQVHYPELTDRYSYVLDTKEKYDGIRDKRNWRLYYWGCDSEPETIKTKVFEAESGIKYYRFALAFDTICPNSGLKIAARKLKAVSRFWTVSENGILMGPYGINPERISASSDLPVISSLFDAGFTRKDFGLRLNRKGNRHILLT